MVEYKRDKGEIRNAFKIMVRKSHRRSVSRKYENNVKMNILMYAQTWISYIASRAFNHITSIPFRNSISTGATELQNTADSEGNLSRNSTGTVLRNGTGTVLRNSFETK
jgi:hypothetical protein